MLALSSCRDEPKTILNHNQYITPFIRYGKLNACLVHEPSLEEPHEVHGDVERDGDEGVEQEGVVEELGEEHPRQAVRRGLEPEVLLRVLVLNVGGAAKSNEEEVSTFFMMYVVGNWQRLNIDIRIYSFSRY